MHIRNLNTILMLVAGIIVAVSSLLFDYSIERTAYTMLIVLVVFFIIGSLVQMILNRIITKSEVREQEELKKDLEDEVHSLEEESPEK